MQQESDLEVMISNKPVSSLLNPRKTFPWEYEKKDMNNAW